MVRGLHMHSWGRNATLLNRSYPLRGRGSIFTTSLFCAKMAFFCPNEPETCTDFVSQRRDSFSKRSSVTQSCFVKCTLYDRIPVRRRISVTFPCQKLCLRGIASTQQMHTMIKRSLGRQFFFQEFAATILVAGLLVCYSSSDKAPTEASMGDDCDSSSPLKLSHGKRVYTDYSVIGIPGDGRCLFRSVIHGAFIRSGKPPPHDDLQRELADELRSNVADEFIKRREEVEWFIEDDFDSYVARIRKPHVWGGEPELLMASHVLRMPITVYMYDKDGGGLISIAEYGQEHGEPNPIRLLYHGFGHYDALLMPSRNAAMSKL